MSDYAIAWLIALGLTLGAETPVYVARIGRPRLRAAALGISASLITHPVLWWVVAPNVQWNTQAWVIAECVITLVEAAWIWSWGAHDRRVRDALITAALANGTSIIVGELVRPFVPYL